MSTGNLGGNTPLIGAIDDPRGVELAREALARGGVAVLPTDTLYGLSALLSCEAGVRRISIIKCAPDDRRYIVLASSIGMVERYVRSFGCATRETLAAAWPAPLSVIVPAGSACPAWVGSTVAVRVPALASLCGLIEKLGEPIVSTSVNRTGSRPLSDPREIEREVGGEVDVILTGATAQPAASTIVDLSGKVPRVVRHGSYAWGADGGGKPSK